MQTIKVSDVEYVVISEHQIGVDSGIFTIQQCVQHAVFDQMRNSKRAGPDRIHTVDFISFKVSKNAPEEEPKEPKKLKSAHSLPKMVK